MAACVGRRDEFHYQVLQKRKINEFGSWSIPGCMLHHRNGVFYFAYMGHRVAEIHPDNTCILSMPPETPPSTAAYKWSCLAENTGFQCKRLRHVSGLDEYEVYRYEYSKGHPHKFSEKIRTTGRFRFNLDGTLSIDGIPQKSITQDRAKYNAFNKRLRDLKAVLYAQIRMNAKTELDWQSRSKLLSEVQKRFKDVYGLPHIHTDDGPYVLVSRWMEQQSPAIASDIADLAFTRCSTSARGIEGMIRQVTNIVTRAQQHFLREHCVTILEPLPGSANDQNRELQQTDGLREVPLPREAEVPRQDPGTAARTTRWKI